MSDKKYENAVTVNITKLVQDLHSSKEELNQLADHNRIFDENIKFFEKQNQSLVSYVVPVHRRTEEKFKHIVATGSLLSKTLAKSALVALKKKEYRLTKYHYIAMALNPLFKQLPSRLVGNEQMRLKVWGWNPL